MGHAGVADDLLILDGPEATAALGARIATVLRPGDLVTLSGALGAGKSVLARGLVRALTSPDEEVPSPTFTLLQVYEGAAFPIAHLDLYRLKRAEEAWELGLEEAFAEGAAVVEWPERLGGDLPADRLAVTLAVPPASDADAGGEGAAGDGLRGWRASGHGRHVWRPFSDPRSLQPLPDLTGRAEAKADFLARAGLADARRQPVAGDASTRAYERLHLPGRSTLVLMDAPPAAESVAAGPDASPAERIRLGYNAMARLAGGRTDAFAAVADWLRAQGLSAPAVVELDAPAGFAVLEDLGDELFVRRLAAGEDPSAVYGAAVDLLAALQREPPPAILAGPAGDWPLLPYDALALRTGVDLFLEWWPRLVGLPPVGEAAGAEWVELWAPVLARGEAGATVFVHRDYHAENLLWLPDRDGVARVGLLDFQDAVRGHPAWDLLHLLQGAGRIDVPRDVAAAMLDRFLAARPELDPEAFLADYAALGALNEARILGPVFARQIVMFGRDKYRAFLPRTWRALERNLEHPGMAALKRWFDRHIPADRRA